MIMSNKEPKQCGQHETESALRALIPAQADARRALDVECIKSAMFVEYRLILETVRTFGFASEPSKADFDAILRNPLGATQNAQTRFMFWEAVAKAIADAAVDAMKNKRIAKLGQGVFATATAGRREAMQAAHAELTALAEAVTTRLPDDEKRQIARDASDLVSINGQLDTSLEIGPAPVAAPATVRWTRGMAPFVLDLAQRARINGKFGV
jgi:hypothetical protein